MKDSNVNQDSYVTVTFLPKSGLFIVLYDMDTLNLYLTKGLYSFLMPPIHGEVGSRSNHYPALADYACGRKDTHVFFFLKRQIIYGGQLDGSDKHGAFYLNGPYCPLGRLTKAPLVWDESIRTRYEGTSQAGVFKVTTSSGEVRERCQPYIIRFQDKMGLRGQTISSDTLYFELGSYPYPLPSNAIQNMSFCTLTPGEVELLIRLVIESPNNVFQESTEAIELDDKPIPFSPEFGISNVREATSESHLEASVLANPSLLPESLRPQKGITRCRQIPISPFKPSQMDRADICYFTDDAIREGTIPNKIIELKNKTAGKNEAIQVVRYVQWLEKILPGEHHLIDISLYAPSFTRNINDYIPREHRNQIKLIPFDGRSRLDNF